MNLFSFVTDAECGLYLHHVWLNTELSTLNTLILMYQEDFGSIGTPLKLVLNSNLTKFCLLINYLCKFLTILILYTEQDCGTAMLLKSAKFWNDLTIMVDVMDEWDFVRFKINPSDAEDGIFQLWQSIPCLLIHWLLKSPVHQQA